MTNGQTPTEPKAFDVVREGAAELSKGIAVITSSKPADLIQNTTNVITNSLVKYLRAADVKSVGTMTIALYGQDIAKYMQKYAQNPLENLGEISKLYTKVLEPMKMRLPEITKDLGTKIEGEEAEAVAQEQENVKQGMLYNKAWNKVLEGLVV